MIHSLLPRHAAIAGAVVLLSLPSALAAETPTPQDLAHATASGSYLAARHAGVERDSATAAAYYLNVLKADPRNADLLSRTFLSVLTDGDIDEAGRLADRLIQLDRNDRIARLVIGVRALKQKQYALARQNFAQSVRGPVTDLTATLLSAWALSGAGDTPRRGRHARPARRAGLVRHLQGPARRPDPRRCQQQEGSRQALRARLQGRPDGAAHRSGVRPLSVAQRQQGRRAEDLSGIQQGVARSSGDRRRDEGNLGRRQTAAARRFAAGRRRRSALRPRCLDRPPRRRRSGADLSAACALSRADARDGAAVARRPLRVAEKARARDQDLRPDPAVVAAAAQRRNPGRLRSRFARSHRRGQEAARSI